MRLNYFELRDVGCETFKGGWEGANFNRSKARNNAVLS